MVKNSLILILMLITLKSYNQSISSYNNKGLIKAGLAYNQSFMTNYKNQNIYLCGDLEYFASNNISIKGDCYWYLDSRNAEKIFNENYIILFGPVFNLPKGKSNFYIGIQPGLSYTKPNNLIDERQTYPIRLMPMFCISTGYTLYFSKFCNFNIGVKYTISKYRGTNNASLNLDELLISGGLGFHLKTKRKSL